MPISNDRKQRDSHITVRLYEEVFDRRCEERGAATEVAKAALVGSPRETLYWIRQGRNPSGRLMMQWARALELPVEELWGVRDV